MIGAMDALTGVGESYGNPIQQAKQLAMEEINAAGGINGRMLEIVFEDSKCAAADAITAYQQADGRGRRKDHPRYHLQWAPCWAASSPG